MFDLKKNPVHGLCMALVLGFLGASRAHADTLPPGPPTLLDHTQLVSGGFADALDFFAPGAGTISVDLTDLHWPDALSGLSFAATSMTSMLSTLGAPGQTSFDVSGPGHYFALISGTTQSANVLGLYSLSLKWVAAGSAPVASVPLPASGWLLLSGAACAALLMRRRRNAGGASFTAFA